MKRAITLIGAGLVISSLLNLGTIKKADDPILKTQTDPISYKQKMEEQKDGPKGAPMPSFNLYPKARFMTDSSVAEPPAQEPQTDNLAGEKVSEVAVDTADEQSSEDWWSSEESDPDKAPEETGNPETEQES